MHIKYLKYSQYYGRPNQWLLDKMNFRDTNLIVGKNAVGKSKALTALSNLAVMISSGIKLIFTEGEFELCLDDDGTELIYILKYTDTKVFEESLNVNGELKLKRGEGGQGLIFAEQLNQDIRFQAPEDELAAVSRRDSIQHSYLEALHRWASSLLIYHFGTSLGKENVILNTAPPPLPDTRNENNPLGVYYHGFGSLGDAFDAAIKEDMSSIGYNLEDVGAAQLTAIKLSSQPPGLQLYGLVVKESDIPVVTEQQEISSGMFRALSLFVQFNYALMTKPPSCLLVDDIGEGLDYTRSLGMIKRLMTKANEAGIQLVMSTNDRFVMNSVPLEKWTVLQREGGHVRVFNYDTSKRVFDDFKFSGLNNFDFFAYDYLNEDKSEEANNEEASDLR